MPAHGLRWLLMLAQIGMSVALVVPNWARNPAATAAILTNVPAARALDTVDEIYLTAKPDELPIQIETPFGPIAGTTWQITVLGLGVLSAIATIARGISDGLSGRTMDRVYRGSAQSSQQPFGRPVEDTIRLASEAKDDDGQTDKS